MQVRDGILRISSAYGLKIPGSSAGSSEDEHKSISLEFPVEGDLEALLDHALTQEKMLDAAVKLAVFESLGVEFKEVAEGVIKPTIPAAVPFPKNEPKGKGKTNTAPPSQGEGSGYTPKVPKDQIPTFSAVINGQVVEVQDLRAFKGTVYKDTAADFRVGKTGYWIFGKDGSPDPMGQYLASVADGGESF